jgi:hypothetical protein
MRRRGQIGEDRRVFYRDLLLVVITIRDPGLNLAAVERSGDEPLMKRVFVMITRLADGMEPVDEVECRRRDVTARVSACESERSGRQ